MILLKGQRCRRMSNILAQLNHSNSLAMYASKLLYKDSHKNMPWEQNAVRTQLSFKASTNFSLAFYLKKFIQA